MLVSVIKSVKRVDSYTQKQLFVHAASGNLAAFERYLTSGGNVDARDEDGLALIHYAACHGNIPLIQALKEHGADLNRSDDGSPPWKPIHYAIFHRQHEAEEVLRTIGTKVPLPILRRIVTEKSRNLWNEKDADVLSARYER